MVKMKTTLIATILGALVVGCWVLQVCTISATAVLETVILGEPHHDPHYDGALMNKMQSKTTSRICVSKPPGHDDQQCLLQPCTASDSLSDYGFLSYNNDTFRGKRMVLSGSANSGSGCAISHQYKFRKHKSPSESHNRNCSNSYVMYFIQYYVSYFGDVCIDVTLIILS